MSRFLPRLALGSFWALALIFLSHDCSAQDIYQPSIVTPAQEYVDVGAPSPGPRYAARRVRYVRSATFNDTQKYTFAPASYVPGKGYLVQLSLPLNEPYEIVVGYFNEPGYTQGWVPVKSYFSVPKDSSLQSATSYFESSANVDYLSKTARRVAPGVGSYVGPDGQAVVDTGMKVVAQKVGVTLVNETTKPQTYVLRPHDPSGNAVEGLASEVVELLPGQTWSKDFIAPADSVQDVFSVSVTRLEWVPDPEWGGVKRQEVPVSERQSLPVSAPNEASDPVVPQQTGGTIPTPSLAPQAAAANSQQSGTGSLTISAQNAFTNNITSELRRLGATVQAGVEVAHSDALASIGQLKAQASGGAGAQVDVSGIVSAVNQGTAATQAVADGVAELKEGLSGDVSGQGNPGEGTPQDDGSYLASLSETLAILKGRSSALAQGIESAWGTLLPGPSNRQSLDFSIATPFGPLVFDISKYDAWISLFRDVIMLVVAWNMLESAIRIFRGAFADAN